MHQISEFKNFLNYKPDFVHLAMNNNMPIKSIGAKMVILSTTVARPDLLYVQCLRQTV